LKLLHTANTAISADGTFGPLRQRQVNILVRRSLGV
jgi:hypothetical protein